MTTYICPMCFYEIVAGDGCPIHCGHGMVEKPEWSQHKKEWLIAREYEISLLPPLKQKEYNKMAIPGEL